MATVNEKLCAQIVYFDTEGRQNLEEVLRVVKKLLKKREELRSHKIVIFTAHGEGPALAYNKLGEYDPRIIAVTFPRRFSVKRDGELYFPEIGENVRKFFKGVGIEVVIPPRLPFDSIDGMDAHNQQLRVVKDTISIFGAGFSLCVQAVLIACDMGFIGMGEPVIAISGDIAGLFTASSTEMFLTPSQGIAIQEIFCKPRNLTVSRPKPPLPKVIEAQISKIESP